jgi:hypothetical protein
VAIGRKTGNTIVLPDDLQVSRHHATILWDADSNRYILEDVGSANGTFLNNQRLTEPQTLSHGDVIQMGETTFTIQLPLVEKQGEDHTIVSPPVLEDADATILATPDLDVDTTMIGISVSQDVENPYVGPRTFTHQESNRFFGREREARELFSLVVSERLVLFYAQSGAGKSSLINTRLVPQLREAGYAVLPIGRVSGELPEGIRAVRNIYVFNLLLSLDESDGDPKRFVDMPLSEFLAKLTSIDGTHYYYDAEPVTADDDETYQEMPYVLIVDQFEEIATTHPDRWQDREEFFAQLDRAMADDPLLWVVFSLREDYVAALDQYIHLLPDKLRGRFYMQRLGHEAALEAIKRPAEQYGRSFAPGVAEALADNLRQIRVYGSRSVGQAKTQLGQFVEPVQLQVACYQLWENLRDRPLGQITEQDLKELGDVDTALAQFYEEVITEAVEKTNVSAIDLREWFESQLITEAGTRGTVYRGRTLTGGLPNQTVDFLTNKFLLRAEVRSGGTWYELVHDRFVTPILQANQAWRLKHPLIQAVHAWADSGKSPGKLYEGQQLADALASNWTSMGPLVKEFLTASQAAQEAREDAQRQRELEQAHALAEEQRKRAEEQMEATARLRRRAVWLTSFVIVAVLFAIASGVLGWTANNERLKAIASRLEAVAAQRTAEAESTAAAANAEAARNLLESQKVTQTAMVVLATGEAEELNLEAAALNMAAENLQATLSAAEATATFTPIPTDTPMPTDTPVGTYVPPSEPSPTNTPTATFTPTPNETATVEVQTAQAQLEQIRVEQTAIAQRATETVAAEAVSCDAKPQGELLNVWERYEERLGCPVTEPITGSYAEQAFDNGFMVWSGILDEFFIMVGGDEGMWQRISNEELVSYNPDGPGCPPPSEPPPDKVQPVRGFGAVWCDWPEIRDSIGWGLDDEYAVSDDIIQEFDNGLILRLSDGSIFVLFSDDGTYIREKS